MELRLKLNIQNCISAQTFSLSDNVFSKDDINPYYSILGVTVSVGMIDVAVCPGSLATSGKIRWMVLCKIDGTVCPGSLVTSSNISGAVCPSFLATSGKIGIVGSCALYALLKPNALYALKNQKRTFNSRDQV